MGNGKTVSRPDKAAQLRTILEALSYSEDGSIYAMTLSPSDVAWIDPTQGQYTRR